MKDLVSLILTPFLIVLLCSSGYGKDKVNLNLVGKWGRSNFFHRVEIVPKNTPEGKFIYAYCGTEKGLLILDVTNPKIPKEIATLNIGRVNDMAFYKSNSDSFNYVALANAWNGLAIIDISNPRAPSYAGGYHTEWACSVAISGDYAYVADAYNGLIILDIADPTAPSYAGGYDTKGEAQSVAIFGNYAFVACLDKGIVIIDITDPRAPSYAAGHDTKGKALSVTISGNYAFVADEWNGLVIIDIEDPTDPDYTGRYPTESAYGVAVSGDYAYVADEWNGLVVINISDPIAPSLAGRCDTQGYAQSVTICGDYAYVANGNNGLVIIDISKKTAAYLEGYGVRGDALCAAAAGDYAYVAAKDKGLMIMNIADPNAPFIAGGYVTQGKAQGVTISGDHAYVADEYGLVIIDISDPTAPLKAGDFITQGKAQSVTISGDHAYVADADNGLVIIDISDPNSPRRTGRVITQWARSVAVSGDYAYVADAWNGLVVIDISNPNAPCLAKEFTTQGDALSIAISGEYAYMADGRNGLLVIDISNPTAPFKAGQLDTQGDSLSVTISGDYAYLADGENGLVIINIADPDEPSHAGGIDTQGTALNAAVSGDYAYIADEWNGLVIIDISNPTAPSQKGGFDTQRGVYAQNIAISGNYAYVAGGDNGLVIIDISNSTAPVYAREYITRGYTQDVAISGNYVYVTVFEYGLVVIDISNPTDPSYAGEIEILGEIFSVAISGNYAYVVDGNGLVIIDISDPNTLRNPGGFETDGWARDVAISGNYAYVADGWNGVVIIDISDPNTPYEAGRYQTQNVALRIAISGNYAYVTDGDSGVVVIDITNPNAPVNAGRYDTFGLIEDMTILENQAYVANGYSLVILDISNPTAPSYVREYPTSGWAEGLAVSGNRAYVTDGVNGLVIIDIAKPPGPTYARGYATSGWAEGLAISGNYAYVADGDNLLIIDIANPNAPSKAGEYATYGTARSVTVSGDYAYVADMDNGLVIIDIADPNTPFKAGEFATQGQARSVTVSGDYAYVADMDNGLVIIDIADPNTPFKAGEFATQGEARTVTISGDYAYVADGNGLVIINISNPSEPSKAGEFATPGAARSVAISGDYAYVADGENGLVIINISNPNEPFNAGGIYREGYTEDIVIFGDHAYAAVWNRLVMINIEDPTNPSYEGEYLLQGAARSVAVSEDYAYVADGNGLVIINIAATTPLSYAGGYVSQGYAEDVAVSGEYAYVADGNGLVIIDVSEPLYPKYIRGYNTLGYAEDVAVSGEYAYVADGNGLVIIDISRPNSPDYAGGINTQGEANSLAISGNHAYIADGGNGLVIIGIENPKKLNKTGEYPTKGYARSVAVSEEHAYVANDTGLEVINISDPTAPSKAGEYLVQGGGRNVAISGNYAYMADGDYRLLVIDISDPNEPFKAGEYDGLGYTENMAIFGNYAYVAIGDGIMVIDIANPTTPSYAGGYVTQGYAEGIAVSGNYAYVSDGGNGLIILKIIDNPYPQGNLVLCSTGPASANNPLWPPSQELANQTYYTFQEQGYPHYSTYYISPKPYQDIDGDGIFDPFVVDDFDPAIADMRHNLTQWAYNRLNTGPFYLYLTGQGTQDAYQVSPGEILKAFDPEDPEISLKYYLDRINLDINNPVCSLYLGGYDTQAEAQSVAVSGEYAYVADGVNGLLVIDISDPTVPFKAGGSNTQGYARSVAVSENHAYLANDTGLEVINISDPNEPFYTGVLDTEGEALSVAISGNYAYVANGENGLVIMDISDPYNPYYIGGQDTLGYAQGVSVSENYAYVADGCNGLAIIDISDPNEPLYTGGYDTQGEALSVAAFGDYAYVADGYNGLVIIDISDPNSPDYAGRYSTQGNIRSVSISGNYAYVADSDYGLVIIDISNPTAPLYADGCYVEYPSDVTISGNYAYMACGGKGLAVINKKFQERIDRDIICLLEFSSSGSFCDDLIDPYTTPYSRTIITCTDEGPSFLDPSGNLSFTGKLLDLLQNSNQPDLFADTGISHEQRVRLLQGLFSQARANFWSSGYPFTIQAPQMVTAQGAHTLYSITLSVDSLESTIPDPNNLTITDPSQTIFLTATGHYLDGDLELDTNQIHYHSSDRSILLVTPEGEAYPNPDTEYNGKAYILATIIDPKFTQAPDHDPNIIPPLGGVTGRISIQVNIPGKKEKEGLPKAIIVAGRCNDPSGYDYLWESTNRMANHAYHTFIDRGYSPSNILYLSHDPNQKGVDGPNGDETLYAILEAIFTDSNNPYLDLNGLTDLTIFLIDHGKLDRFILGPTDEAFLSPYDLDHWLDDIQKEYTDAVITIIMEACYSGCFVNPLSEGAANRIIITSTQEATAYLAANGWVSFSYFLFNYLKSGANLANAFEKAYLDIASLSWGGIQHPIIQDNQNRGLAARTLLGGSFILSQDQPYIFQVSEFEDPNHPIIPHSPVEMWARVTDLDGVERVWAIISASQSSLKFSGAMDDPVVGLPMVELLYDPNTGRYEGTYQGFDYGGPYAILYLAQDTKGMVSYPRIVHVSVEGYNQDRAFILADNNLLSYGDFAQWVLEERRFPRDSIYRPDNVDALCSGLEAITDALHHLLIYCISLTPLSDSDVYRLDTCLERVQGDTNCTAVILMDTPYSGNLLEQLTPPEGQKRIMITGADPNHFNFADVLGPPFSQFFFSGIYNGMDVNQAYHAARFAVGYYSQQNPLLDDNGNGIPLEYGADYDGKFSNSVYLGSPFEAVAAGPRITLPEMYPIHDWDTFTATIWARITDPDPNSYVWALIISPQGVITQIDLEYHPDHERFEADHAGFTEKGIYKVVVFFQEPEGLLDYDETVVLVPDVYEADDEVSQAKAIMVNKSPQEHNFHNPTDVDWTYFYAYKGLPYQVKAAKAWSDCQLMIEIFDPNGIPVAYSSPYVVGFSAPQNGFYFVRISYTCPALPSSYPSYHLFVVCPAAGYGGIWGWVRDKDTLEGIVGAEISTPYDGRTTSMHEWTDPGYTIKAGFYFMSGLHTPDVSGWLVITAEAAGYEPTSTRITDYENNLLHVDFYLEMQGTPPSPPPPDQEELRLRVEYIQEGDTEIRVEVPLYKGLNLFSHPSATQSSVNAADNFLWTYETGFDSLTGPADFLGIRQYDMTCYFMPSNGQWSVAYSNDSYFTIASGESNIIYMMKEKTLEFSIPFPNKGIDLYEGTNYIGISSPPSGYTSYKMLKDMGTSEDVAGISGFDPIAGRWLNTCWEFNRPSGDCFFIRPGAGYLVFMKKDKTWIPD